MKRIIAITTLAAAMLLGGTASAGWYAMSPPLENGVVITNAPLSRWNSGGAFDSASQCENILTRNHATVNEVRAVTQTTVILHKIAGGQKMWPLHPSEPLYPWGYADGRMDDGTYVSSQVYRKVVLTPGLEQGPSELLTEFPLTPELEVND